MVDENGKPCARCDVRYEVARLWQISVGEGGIGGYKRKMNTNKLFYKRVNSVKGRHAAKFESKHVHVCML